MGDTFQFSVHNPAEAEMDITGVYIVNPSNPDDYINAVENDTVNFDLVSVDIWVGVKNIGEEAGTATVTLKDGSDNILETKDVSIGAGSEVSVTLDSSGAHYEIPDGETKTFKAEVTP